MAVLGPGRWYIAEPKVGEPQAFRVPFRAMMAAEHMTGEVDLVTQQDDSRVVTAHRNSDGEWIANA